MNDNDDLDIGEDELDFDEEEDYEELPPRKAAVILSGCGFLDGAEIREAVISLLVLSDMNATVTCFAPDIDQHHVVNHLTGEVMQETRNIRIEAARIARGEVKDLKDLNPSQFDLLVIPGGYGVAKNLSDFATKGADATVLPAFKAAVGGFLRQKKPIAAICIAPAVLAAAVKGEKEITVTIGDDPETAAAIRRMGSTHQSCDSDQICIDVTHKIVSCSAYMREDPLADIAMGIDKCISQAVELCG